MVGVLGVRRSAWLARGGSIFWVKGGVEERIQRWTVDLDVEARGRKAANARFS